MLFMSMFVVLLAAVVCCACISETTSRRITVIAHRGAHEQAPENTMLAILAAAELGCDYVEVDVRETRDGGFVNFHDGSVDNKTNGTGDVADMTLAEMLSLDAGSFFDSSFAGERIITVDEAFTALAESGMGAYIDVKSANPDSVAALIRRNGLISNAATYCNADFLAEIQRIDPEVEIQPEMPRDLADLPALMERLKPEIVAISRLSLVTRENVDACHAAGALVWVDIMGRDNPEGWQFIIDCGVDGIQTDKPSELIPWLRERGLRE
jgi:glycerophosphoryl diester phosphodiesterase